MKVVTVTKYVRKAQ